MVLTRKTEKKQKKAKDDNLSTIKKVTKFHDNSSINKSFRKQDFVQSKKKNSPRTRNNNRTEVKVNFGKANVKDRGLSEEDSSIANESELTDSKDYSPSRNRNQDFATNTHDRSKSSNSLSVKNHSFLNKPSFSESIVEKFKTAFISSIESPSVLINSTLSDIYRLI